MKIIFHDSRQLAEEVKPGDLAPRLERDLEEHQERLLSQSVAEIIEGLQRFRLKLSDHRNPLQARYRHLGLAFLLNFLYSENLEGLLDTSLRDRRALDGIVEHRGLRLTATPRGVAGHWMAGNVPFLSFISVLQCLLTKNVSLVKISSRAEDTITPLLQELAAAKGCRALSDSVTVLAFPSDDMDANLAMNSLCRTRIFWGSREAVDSLEAMPRRPETVDCVFGPKISAAVVAPELLTDEAAANLAVDVTLFNQEACSSPHYLFVRGDAGQAREAARKLGEALAGLHERPLASRHGPGEASRILNFRAEWCLEGGEIVCDGGTSWTIALPPADLDRLPPALGSRVVTVVPFADARRIEELLPANAQTVTTLLPKREREEFVLRLARLGVARFPEPGHANDYVLPWDGGFVLDRLVNWAVLA